MKKVVVEGDTFGGNIKIGSRVYHISGRWVKASQNLVTANGQEVVVEGSIGEYLCPVDNTMEQVIAKASSRLDGVNGARLHRIGDSVEVVTHENINVVTTSGQSNVLSD